MITRLAVILLATASVLAQEPASQPPPPSAGEPDRAGQGQAEPAQEQSQIVGTEQTPAVVRILPTPATEQEAAQEQAARYEETLNRWVLAGLTFVIACFSGWLIRVGYLQRRTYEATLTASKAIERAYIGMSHHPPGIEPKSERISSEPSRWKHQLSVRIKITNHGNTPARITRSLVQLILTNADIPRAPAYDERQARPGHVFLVKSDSFTITTPYEFQSSGEKRFSDAFRELAEHGHRLYVIAYVDYIDTFGRRHRAGYGRLYEPAIDDPNRPDYRNYRPVPDDAHGVERRLLRQATEFDPSLYAARNNLVLLTQPGYNYDRERKKGEGNDWDDPR
jgi:hypothetical protein